MHHRLRFRPSPLTTLVAIVLCLMAGFAFGQVRRIAPGASGIAAPAATTGLPAGSPSPSGLTSGAAPGLVRGTPSPSGLTSGSAPVLPAGSPVGSGLTSGTAGGSSAVVVPARPTDTTTTATGGSTRGVVVIPVDTGAGATMTGTTAGTTGTTSGAAGSAGLTGGVAIVQPGGFAGVTNGVVSVSPTRAQMGGPITAVQVVQLFSHADSDGDGLLTRAEALRLPMVTMSFDDMDTNRDGVVSRSEYEASLR